MRREHRNTCAWHSGRACDCGYPNVPTFDVDGPAVEPVALEPFQPDVEGEW